MLPRRPYQQTKGLISRQKARSADVVDTQAVGGAPTGLRSTSSLSCSRRCSSLCAWDSPRRSAGIRALSADIVDIQAVGRAPTEQDGGGVCPGQVLVHPGGLQLLLGCYLGGVCAGAACSTPQSISHWSINVSEPWTGGLVDPGGLQLLLGCYLGEVCAGAACSTPRSISHWSVNVSEP